MDPWASPWAEEEDGSAVSASASASASAAASSARHSTTPPPTQAQTQSTDIDPWAAETREAAITDLGSAERRQLQAESPVVQPTSQTSTDSAWPAAQSDDATTQDPWASREAHASVAALPLPTTNTTAATGGWGDDDGSDGISGMPRTWQPAAGVQESLRPSSPPEDQHAVEDTNPDDPWASAPSRLATRADMAPVTTSTVTSPSATASTIPTTSRLPDKPTPPTAKPDLPPVTVEPTAAAAPAAPDSGPGWELKKKQGAAAFADKLGGWMRGAVARGDNDSAAPQVASAQDEEEEEEQQQPAAKLDFFDDSIEAQPQQPSESSQTQQQTAVGRFFNRWRGKPAEQNEQQRQQNTSGVDADGLDWLSAQGGGGSNATAAAGAAPTNTHNAFEFNQSDDLFAADSIGSRYPASTNATRVASALPTSSTQRGVAGPVAHGLPPRQSGPSRSSRSGDLFAAAPSRSAADPFDFSEFEEATPTVATAATGRTTTARYPGRINAPKTAPAPTRTQPERHAVDPFDVFQQSSSAAQANRTPVHPPAPSFYSGRAQEDDFEQSGFDYRDDDESADDWGWGVEEARSGGAYSDNGFQQRSRSTAPLPPPKQQQRQDQRPAQPTLPNLGSVSLNRAASLSSAPVSRPSSSASATSNKRASFLPPPPPGRNHAQGAQARGGGGGTASTLLARSSSASGPHQQQQQQQQQQQPQSRPSSSLSRGAGMTSDDLAFFEGL